jgi:uncharacterized protein YkwD
LIKRCLNLGGPRTDGSDMHARIAATAALLSIALLATPALADECPLLEGAVSGCQEQNPQPEPEPEPQPQPSQPQPSQPQPSEPDYGPAAHRPAAVARLLDLMNGERRRSGLPLFALRADVSAIAARHSEAMAARGTIWHNDGYFTEATRRKLDARLLGENVARNPEIDDAHRRLMNSPGHRGNILDGRFTVVGLAVYHDGQGNLYVTQNFVQPNARPAAQTAPAPPTAAGNRAPQAPAPTTTQPPAPSPAAASTPAPEPAPAVVMGEVSEPPADEIAPPASTEAPTEQGSGPVALMALVALLMALSLVVARVARRRSTGGRAGGPVLPAPPVAVPGRHSRFLPSLPGLGSIFSRE